MLDFNNKLTVTKGQLEYEMYHLQKKLAVRDTKKFIENKGVFFGEEICGEKIESHPLFRVVEGDIEKWERIK